MSFDLTTLNNEQLAPVRDTEGAVLVTAGAGSGKTRLLTHRIAYIISEGKAERYNVLAITFTNKATNEMRERLDRMIDKADQIWIFTFHALCVRILRKFADKLGYKSNFSIYGESEKNNSVKRIVKKMVESGKLNEAGDFEKKIIGHISKAKNDGIAPDDYATINKFLPDIEIISEAYAEYEKMKKQANAFDYDDLLDYAYKLISTDAEARDYYQTKFKYIHIDEFQDTNTIQYKLVSLLAGKHHNIFAVGDEDQSIYGWRGANFENIFKFQQDFNCKVYKLEQNYRSTKRIIETANKVIKNNKSRMAKVLWTAKEEGEAVTCYQARGDREEANFVIKKISSYLQSGEYGLNDIAVLMRVNSLSRQFEEGFLSYNIPHRIYGGFKFYDRKEIKDVMAYLKLMVNPQDTEALLRIINFPKRGIGESTVAQLANYCAVTGRTMYDVVLEIEKNDELPAKISKKFVGLSNVLQCLANAYSTGATPGQLGKYVVSVLNLKEYYGGDDDENVNRRMNIKELLNGMAEFDKANGGTLEEYLQSISLYSDTDDEQGENCVTISTIHSAKGLEFKVVFVVGLEEGIFPSSGKNDSESDIEEERRLMYVAVTRAMEVLYLTFAKQRFRFNKLTDCLPSRFLKEAGFSVKEEPPKPKAYDAYGGASYGYFGGRYRGERSYSKNTDDRYSREEVPVYSESSVFGGRKEAVKPPQKDASKFVVGIRVRHSKYGDGTIVGVSNKGEVCVEVNFDSVGKLTLMLNYAPLEII